MFLCFYVFLYFLNFVFLLSYKTKTYKITNLMHFSISWSKTPFPGHSECFVAVLTSCQKS